MDFYITTAVSKPGWAASPFANTETARININGLNQPENSPKPLLIYNPLIQPKHNRKGVAHKATSFLAGRSFMLWVEEHVLQFRQ